MTLPDSIVFLGDSTPETRALAEALGAKSVVVPTTDLSGNVDDTPDIATVVQRACASRERADHVVVCTWPAEPLTGPAIGIDASAWGIHVEAPLVRWSEVLVAAALNCADDGSVVVVVEKPAALDSAGQVATVTVGDGLMAFARSAALASGPRGVRVNVVSTEVMTAPAIPLGSPPPLATFPGRVDTEVAGAVRMLLGDNSRGITGTVVRADCGREW